MPITHVIDWAIYIYEATLKYLIRNDDTTFLIIITHFYLSYVHHSCIHDFVSAQKHKTTVFWKSATNIDHRPTVERHNGNIVY